MFRKFTKITVLIMILIGGIGLSGCTKSYSSAEQKAVQSVQEPNQIHHTFVVNANSANSTYGIVDPTTMQDQMQSQVQNFVSHTPDADSYNEQITHQSSTINGINQNGNVNPHTYHFVANLVMTKK